jgi:hypothetical protein
LVKIPNLLLAFLLLGSGCYSSDDYVRKSDREQINALTVSCGHTHTSGCSLLGDDLTGTSLASRLSTWREAVDLPLAKRVYQLGCESGEGGCCRALVEQKLATSPEETTRYGTLAKAYGLPVRSAEEIAAAETEMQARVDKREERITADRTEERNKSAQDMQAAGALIQQTGQQIQQSLAVRTTTTPTPTKSSPVMTAAPAPSGATLPVQHCRNPYKESRSHGDLVCITTDVGHPCIQDNECDTSRCMVPGVAALHDPGESGNGVCCSQSGRSCDKQHPCCPEAHCVPQYNIGAADEAGMCGSN